MIDFLPIYELGLELHRIILRFKNIAFIFKDMMSSTLLPLVFVTIPKIK